MTSRQQQFRQIGALPFHFGSNGAPRIYLVTSRGGGRWIIPKGNPIRGLAPHKVAAREALEEAGLIGHIKRDCIGTFEFDRCRQGLDMTCHIDVYALEVDRQLRYWAEAGQRSVQSCDLATALSLVTSPGLSVLIEQFLARGLRSDATMACSGQIAAQSGPSMNTTNNSSGYDPITLIQPDGNERNRIVKAGLQGFAHE